MDVVNRLGGDNKIDLEELSRIFNEPAVRKNFNELAVQHLHLLKQEWHESNHLIIDERLFGCLPTPYDVRTVATRRGFLSELFRR